MCDLRHQVSFFRKITVALLSGALFLNALLLAAEGQIREGAQRDLAYLEAELPSAAVEIDGNVLFRVHGVSAFPAEKRAAAIIGRIEALAADASVPADAVQPVEVENGTAVVAGNQRVMLVTEADGRLEATDHKVLAHFIVLNIRRAIADYRQARSQEALINSVVRGIVATVIFASLVAFVIRLSRWLHAELEQRYRQRIRSLGIQSFQLVRSERIWDAARRGLDGIRTLVLILIGFIYLQYLLGLLPWTRGRAHRLLEYVLGPLANMGWGIVNEIPAVMFLALLFLATRYLLKLIHLYFGAIERGQVKFSGFPQEWAAPTYKLLRVGIIVFAVVVAYPYIPGSETGAFKGISIFIGVIISLGSSSAIANLVAGYVLVYRLAFKVGDRVKIGDTIGEVREMRLQATYLKTIKNEEVIVPNSTILNQEVVNYSTLARSAGLILHTTVGIGYEIPWRQVEAMLLLAAERTPGLMKEPPPFILQRALGDFAVTYELNVYCDNAQAMEHIYTDLHRNVLDLFNEYDVQIMTPAYERDPAERKVVPKEQWFSAPAKGPGPGLEKP